MEEIFNAVLTASFHASIVGLVIIFVKWILKDKINPGWHYLIWAVLILKLFIPFTPPSPASIFNVVPAVTQNVDFARLPVKDNHELPATDTKGKFLSNAAADKESIKRDDFLEKAKKTAAYIWISVFVFSIVFAIYTNFAFRGRLKKRNKTAPEWIYKILEKEKQRLGVKGEIEIIVQDIINTPSLFGIYKPKLLISPAILNLGKENISYIILHELAHLKRRDIMANYLLLFLQMMHWFNPLIWWFFKIIRQDMEMAADEMVLVLLEGPERKEYGKTLISVLESFNSQKPSLKLVGMVDDAGNIERRLKMIKMADLFKYKRRLFVITGVICFAILSFVLLTNPIAKNSLQIGSYIVEVPDNFRVKTDTPGLITQKNTIFGFITGTKIISFKELVFEENNVTVGGIQIIRYEPDQRLFLPNHSQVKSQEEIKGLITKAVMVNLDLTQPAASKDTSVKNENHLYLIFEKDGIAYDIYADSKYVDKTQLIKIAKSFRPSDNSGAIRSVEQFGRNLKKVDKLSPEKVCREQIKENYSAYVAPSLLSEWLEDPSKAPGRYTSSPWPDRIEIRDLIKISKDKYTVKGDIVEITSVPGEEWMTGITLTVERTGKDWLITGFNINEQSATFDENYIENYMPLAKGNYWEYSYKIKESSAEGRIIEKNGTIKMEVQSIHRAMDYTVVEMKGDILNLQPDGRFGFLATSNKIYWLDEATLNNVLNRIGELQQFESLSEILGEGTGLMFEFPLYDGQKFGGDPNRSDLMYIWVVSHDGEFLGKENKSFKKYRLEYCQSADTTTVVFVPGIGITSFSYHHNGTIDDRMIELVDYKITE